MSRGEKSCDCPAYRSNQDCVHVLLYINAPDIFQNIHARLENHMRGDPVILVRYHIDDFLLVYSVQQSGNEADAMENQGRRVVVYRERNGQWRCSQQGRGCRGLCNHINHARNDALEEGYIEENDAEDEDDGVGDDLPLGADGEGVREVCRQAIEVTISNRPRPPPAAILFQSDNVPFSYPPLHGSCPQRLHLDEGARCRCGELLSDRLRGQGRSFWTDFRVLHTTGVEKVHLETVRCPRPGCGRDIGPDLAFHGLVNFNNEIGFSRNVFDLYISLCTRSETPLHAFHSSIIDNYVNLGSQDTFVSIKTFTRAFFAFLKLIGWGTVMTCPECGPNPEVVIMDGTVIHFSAHYLTGSLRPATLPTVDSQDRPCVIYTPLACLHKDIFSMTANGFQQLRQDVHEWCRIVNLRALRAFPHSLQELFQRNVSVGAEEVDRKVGIALKAFLGTLLEPVDLPPRHQRALRLFLGQVCPFFFLYLAWPPC